MIKITAQWLKEKSACQEGIDWFIKKKAEGMAGDLLVRLLIKEEKLDWANWLIVRIMSYKQYVSYAVFAAECVLDIFEKNHPDDKRPRQAIEAAKKCIDNPTKKNKNAAYAAAYAAAHAAGAAAHAAYAAYAAYAAGAAHAAEAAAGAAEAAAYAAERNKT